MGQRQKLDLEVPADMTPMIDCVFQLIIFLMIVVDLSQQDLEDFKLPVAEHALPDENPEPNRPIVNVDQEGRIIIKRRTVYDPAGQNATREPLRAQLRLWARKMEPKLDEALGIELPDGNLLLRGDEFTDWYHLAKVMEDCGQKTIMIWKVQLAVAESQEARKKREKAEGGS
jgi:biopolymer transport protein ExbD